MKRILIIFVLCFVPLFASLVLSESILPAQEIAESSKITTSSAEELFFDNMTECLSIMEKAAQEMSITGVAMIAYFPGEVCESWISKMKVVGRLANENVNFLAVAYAKASEMAVTLQNSGDEERKDIIGETGWQGGVIKKVDSGFLVAAFSGGTGEQDVEVSTVGVEWLSKFF